VRLTHRRRTLALVPVALSLLLASCGGDSSKETGSASVASAPSGTTSTTPESGASGATGAKARAKKKSRHKSSKQQANGTGGAAPAESGIDALKRRLKREKQRIKREGAKIKEKAQKKGDKGGSSTPTTTTPPPPPKPSASPQQVLYNKAKRVCDELTLNGLAQKYNVDATPEAVSTAYAASYPETFRQAVHDGCLSAFA
jgi:hypothetical protein